MIIAITGGIGSGKSLISRIIRNIGHLVYDCDSEAKRLMNTSIDIKRQLQSAFGADIIDNNQINRPLLSKIAFTDTNALQQLNSIVHPIVITDFIAWIEKNKTQSKLWVESAILRESGLDKIVDEAWVVEAPLKTRLQRVIKRDNTNINKVEARINSQSCNLPFNCPVKTIINDDRVALLPQLIKLGI